MTNNSLKKMQLVLATLALSAYCCSAGIENYEKAHKILAGKLTPLKLVHKGLRWNKMKNWYFNDQDGKLEKHFEGHEKGGGYRDTREGEKGHVGAAAVEELSEELEELS
jgi:hypothetical protein